MFIVAIYFAGRPIESIEEEELKRVGGDIVIAIGAFREAHGRLPVTIEEAGCDSSAGGIGTWRYDISSDGTTYSLAVGDYSLNQCEIRWDDTSKRWWVNR